jgi:uncharacterized protein YciI
VRSATARRCVLVWVGLVSAVVACTASPSGKETTAQSAGQASTLYDSALAARLGADDYGMRSYVMAFLKPGPNRGQDSATAASIQRAHLENIRRLAQAGKLVLAGPFEDDGPFAGIFVFDVPTVDEARALTETDPAVKAGRLTLELHPWYGSAALREVSGLHARIAKKNPG